MPSPQLLNRLEAVRQDVMYYRDFDLINFEIFYYMTIIFT